MIYLKIKKDDSIMTYVSILKKYDKSLSLTGIKRKIENHEFIIEHNLHSPFDLIDDINGLDKNLVFRNLITKLLTSNAIVEVHEDDRLISLELLDNLIERMKQIEKDTLIDVDNELDK